MFHQSQAKAPETAYSKEKIQQLLTFAGLGFWQIKKDAAGQMAFEAHESFLRLTGLTAEPVPFDLFLAEHLGAQEAVLWKNHVDQCFDGKVMSFSLTCHFSQPKQNLTLRLNTCGQLDEGKGQKNLLVISGYCQVDQSSLHTPNSSPYGDVLNCLPLPVVIYDANDRCDYLNSAAAHLHGGLDLKKHLGKSFAEMSAIYQDTDIVKSEAKSTTTFKRHVPNENRIYLGQVSDLKDDLGHTIGRIEIMQDISEASEASERVRIMLDATPLACNFWTCDKQNIACNKAATILFGMENQEEYLSNFHRLSPEVQPNGRLSHELAGEYIDEAFKNGKVTFEWMHQKLDGTQMPCEITLVRVATRTETIVAGYTRDLRELRATQAERDTERKLLKTILDSTPVCFAITVGGIIQFITPFGHDFSGRAPGDSIRDLCVGESTYDNLLKELAEKKSLAWHPIKVKRKDGEERSMLLNSYITNYYGEVGAMSWLIDITEMKNKELELQAARDAAEESTKAKSEFLANMSHEIRTPMNAILGLIHLVQQTNLNDLQFEYLTKVESAAKSLLRIINDILDFSKIEANRLEMETEEFYLADVLQTVVDLVSTQTHEKSLEFIVNVPPKTPAGLVGDQIRLAQIL
ncbi:MAG: histidine kinase dimerization/phospho-acceptor domain-containing protein, partial [Candidatus Adiutrix sp.]